MDINSCQGKVNNVLSRSRNVIVVRKRNLASSSLPIATSSSSLISTAIQQIKCELFVLASLVVPRHRPWGLSEEKLCDIRIGTSQDIERSENEYGIIHNNELNDITCNSALGSRNTLQQENFGLLLNGVIARTSSQASGSALLRFTRMALDPERLGSVIQFYRQKHVAAMAEVKSDPNCARQEQDEFAFVVRSSRLPIVRVGLYGATQKRLWTSAGSIDITGELSKDTIDG
ncbi:hypothetical protein BGZ46_006888 [Entomortierella lignicola]|nr:hypothetical protein BGZ46_006888 [Entomortierella lignicola]